MITSWSNTKMAIKPLDYQGLESRKREILLKSYHQSKKKEGKPMYESYLIEPQDIGSTLQEIDEKELDVIQVVSIAETQQLLLVVRDRVRKFRLMPKDDEEEEE